MSMLMLHLKTFPHPANFLDGPSLPLVPKSIPSSWIEKQSAWPEIMVPLKFCGVFPLIYSQLAPLWGLDKGLLYSLRHYSPLSIQASRPDLIKTGQIVEESSAAENGHMSRRLHFTWLLAILVEKARLSQIETDWISFQSLAYPPQEWTRHWFVPLRGRKAPICSRFHVLQTHSPEAP